MESKSIFHVTASQFALNHRSRALLARRRRYADDDGSRAGKGEAV
jgi:hypothetical protein